MLLKAASPIEQREILKSATFEEMDTILYDQVMNRYRGALAQYQSQVPAVRIIKEKPVRRPRRLPFATPLGTTARVPQPQPPPPAAPQGEILESLQSMFTPAIASTSGSTSSAFLTPPAKYYDTQKRSVKKTIRFQTHLQSCYDQSQDKEEKGTGWNRYSPCDETSLVEILNRKNRSNRKKNRCNRKNWFLSNCV